MSIAVGVGVGESRAPAKDPLHALRQRGLFEVRTLFSPHGRPQRHVAKPMGYPSRPSLSNTCSPEPPLSESLSPSSQRWNLAQEGDGVSRHIIINQLTRGSVPASGSICRNNIITALALSVSETPKPIIASNASRKTQSPKSVVNPYLQLRC